MPDWIAGWAGRALYLVPEDEKCVWNWELLEEFSPCKPVGCWACAGDQDGAVHRAWTAPDWHKCHLSRKAGNPPTLPHVLISKAQSILQFWLDDWHEEEDISKSEWAPHVTCWGGAIREIATLKLLVGSSELAVPLQRIVRLDCVFPGDFTIEGWHWWAGKGLNAGQLMRVGPDEDDISTSPCIWHVCSNRITGESSTLL